MKVVLNRRLPPVGPLVFPTDCNSRHWIEPVWEQLSMLASGSIPFDFTAQTRLLSSELCQVAFPLSGGTMPGFGPALMLWKCVMIWNCAPSRSVKRVASGRAAGLQAVPPVGVGRHV